ncbi:predicted protein [Arabidopsis lyrata subsp. lyrata]|uniref:Predicted protein n=1 Tax=Arabidopsis lyrata subsp. lyrata TaxID=81972 RepID=D7KPF7_ARALL|nr:predicted protein [Arabidopsis lyrata subsp. lyrata]
MLNPYFLYNRVLDYTMLTTKEDGSRETGFQSVLVHHTLTVYWTAVEETSELARRSIYHATFRDGASGGVASVYHVGPEGWTKLSGDDVEELHYHYYPVAPAIAEQVMEEATAE